MKVTFVLFLVAVAAIIIEAKPRFMPDDMPADLKQEAETLHQEIKKWKSENEESSWRDMPDELKTKIQSIKDKYEKATGNEWPRRGGRRRGGSRSSGKNETSTN